MPSAMNPDESLQGNAELVSPGGQELPGADSRASRGRTHRRAASAYHVCERLTEATLCFAVVFNPWVFGTTQEWAIWIMNIAGYVLGGLLAMKWLVRLATGYCPARWSQSHGQSSSTGSRWLIRAMAVMTILFLGYVLASAINARALFHVERLDFEYLESVPWLPHSYDRSATWFEFWEYLGLACTFWAARAWLCGMTPEELEADERAVRASASTAPTRSWRHGMGAGRMPVRLRRLLMVLCLTGSLAGLEGIVQRLAGSNKLLFLVQPRFNQETENQFGPYANRNNAAEYFNLLWPLCAGLAFLSAQAANRDRREGLRRRGNAHRWLAAGAVLMGACPLIASSRGGSLIALGMLPVALVVMLAIPRRVSTGGKVGLGLLFAAAIQVAVVFGWDALEPRFEDVSVDDLGGRLAAYKNAEGMARDYPLFGSGAGTFASVYWLYRTDPDTEWCAYLHNDWLEWRITLGWIGFALLLALLAGTFAHWFLGPGVPLPGLLAALVWLAMAGCLVHARFDFPFRVHSVATVFLLYCSVLSCSSRAQK
jgi:O-antigen ligase